MNRTLKILLFPIVAPVLFLILVLGITLEEKHLQKIMEELKIMEEKTHENKNSTTKH